MREGATGLAWAPEASASGLSRVPGVFSPPQMPLGQGPMRWGLFPFGFFIVMNVSPGIELPEEEG